MIYGRILFRNIMDMGREIIQHTIMLIKSKSPKGGFGIYTTEPILKGGVIFKFRGPIKQLKDISDTELDYNLQIGRDTYVGPSEDIDDYFNHSCNPNSFVSIGGEPFLLPLRDIAIGEEIVFDYAITCTEIGWQIECDCGSSMCRKIIGSFMRIPRRRRMYYLKLGIVPEYVLKETLHEV